MWRFNTPMLVTWLDAATDLGFEGPPEQIKALEPQLQLTETLGRFVKLEDMQLVLATDCNPEGEPVVRWLYRIPIQLVVSIRLLSPGRQVYSMAKATSMWTDAARSMWESICATKMQSGKSRSSAATSPATPRGQASGDGESTRKPKRRRS